MSPPISDHSRSGPRACASLSVRAQRFSASLPRGSMWITEDASTATTVLPPSLQGGPAGPVDVPQGGSPRGSRAGVAFFGEVESDGRRGRDRSTTEFQARPDVDRDDPEADVAGDIGGRKSMP